MRILRSSLWTNYREPPSQIAIIRDCDVVDTLESIRVSTTEKMNKEGSLVLCDLFDVPSDTSVEVATIEAGRRTNRVAQTEKHQATLYFWTVDRMLPHIPKDTSAAYPDPPPLSRERVIEVMDQVARHPNYQGQKLGVPINGDQMVVLQHGKIQ